jgi:FAD/FMN-containing dehydrogenase/Fe-S oxidoreductase
VRSLERTALHRGERGDHGGLAELETALTAALGNEVWFDAYTKHLYSTDASMYAIEPIGVVCPRDGDDVVAVIEIARRFGVPVLPRGAGTSLGGQAVGRAVVLDFSRHMHGILIIDAEERIARVQPGVVQDELNLAAGAHGLWFAPDTSTSNRATIGGMIGNNSCGSRSARYGMTIDHVAMLDVVLSDGSRARFGPVEPGLVEQRARGHSLEATLYRDVPRLIAASADAIRTDFPSHWRRSGGYRLERLLPERGRFDLAKVVVGSEGTLAVVAEAAVRLVPRPVAVAALAGHFESVIAALGAVDDARECDAAAIELVDRTILTLARRSPLHGHLVSVLEGDPGALLWVEFYGDTAAEANAAVDRLEAKWRAHRHGYAVVRATTPPLLRRFRDLRKAGLGLLMAAGEGNERSVAFVEDTAVDPRRLREYTERFAAVLSGHGLRAGFYGHASAGCLHVRPFLDLSRRDDVRKLRVVAEEIRDLVAEFDGMNSSEHGDGLVRSEFNRRLFGDPLYAAMRELKRLFDPDDRLNPGKKVDAPSMTENLRDAALPPAGPLTTHVHFDAPDGMRGLANRCARIGACRKSAEAGGTMCPSFMATRDEAHSTRGRANALVYALSSPDPAAALGDQRLYDILDLCLECKACKTECPLSVDMALLKSEFLAHYHERHGVPLQARVFGHARTLNRVGSALAPISNALANARPVRAIAERFAGIDRRRPLPRFRRETLQRWFERRRAAASPRPGDRGAARGKVVFLADSFASYTEPEVGQAAIELLEQAGWDVWLAADVCCGRALISKGLLDEARSTQAALIERLAPAAREGIPIVGCEPSCVLTLKDELLALKHEHADGARQIAQQARLVDELITEALVDGSLHLESRAELFGRRILFHAHCHQKAASATSVSIALLEQIPGAEVTALDTGCCGMAGSFGFERAHYDLSLKIGGLRLFPAIGAAPPDALIAATGVSCRQQIAHATGRAAVHPVNLIHAAMRKEQE